MGDAEGPPARGLLFLQPLVAWLGSCRVPYACVGWEVLAKGRILRPRSHVLLCQRWQVCTARPLGWIAVLSLMFLSNRARSQSGLMSPSLLLMAGMDTPDSCLIGAPSLHVSWDLSSTIDHNGLAEGILKHQLGDLISLHESSPSRHPVGRRG